MNLHQQTFVTEYLRHRNQVVAYKIAYKKDGSNYNALESAANRLLKHPEVSAAINDVLNGIRAEVEQELKAELKQELLTVQKKRELLAQIAMGEMAVEQNYKGKDCNVCTQYVRPTINQMLRAIHLDSKLAGHYPKHVNAVAPAAHETQDKRTVQNSSFEGGVRLPADGGCSLAPETPHTAKPTSYHLSNKSPHNLSRQQREGDRRKATRPVILAPQPAQSTPEPVSQEPQDNRTIQNSSFEGGVRLPADGGCSLAPETPHTAKPTSYQHQNTSPHKQKKKKNTTNHNKTIQQLLT